MRGITGFQALIELFAIFSLALTRKKLYATTAVPYNTNKKWSTVTVRAALSCVRRVASNTIFKVIGSEVDTFLREWLRRLGTTKEEVVE